MAAFDGEERVLATAHHIVRSLGTTETMTDDMLKILSKFDDRFSSMNEVLPKKQESGACAESSQEKEAATSEKQPVVETNEVDLEAVEKVVMQWDMASSEAARACLIWECSRDEVASYLQAVDELQSVLESLNVSQSNSNSDRQDHAQSLQQVAMQRLEEEFRHMLVNHSESVDPEWLMETLLGGGSNNSNVEEATEADVHSSGEEEGEEDVPVARPVADLQLDLLPPEIVSDLSDIARRMIQAGYARDCCQVYTTVRKPVLEESLGRLGVEKLTIDEVQKMPWDTLEGRIKKWIQAMKVSVKVLFASEGRLCDQVFAESVATRETCFSDVAQSSIMQLLSFSEAIAISRRTPEKLFKILDMYETLRDLIPEIEAIFTGEGCTKVRSEAAGILMRLGEAARGTFAEFENAIHRDTSRTPVPGGAVHPLTRYVMNYIRFLFDYTETLKQLFGDKKKEVPKLLGEETNGVADFLGDDDKAKNNEKSPLAVQTIWITHVLESNLDGKSKLYKDLSLTYLFLMNNVHYIVQKVKNSEVRGLLGDDWVRKHNSMVRQHATSYQRAAWGKVLSCLRDEGIHATGSAASGVSRVVLKDRFKSFNAAFEDVHKVQSSWIIPDPQLRDELRISIADKLLSAYRSFLGRYRTYLETGKHPEKYIKFGAEDLEKYLNDLFEGSSGSMTLRRKSFSSS
ncbi:exocyst complex component 7 [Marchantia polymorpha subsp. ruderalis]|nr:hypothetical protein MARPO_0153s0012 [Marchantia polymorpha]BBM98606.1 hypothetical protein Mp_1g14780 [Marchantia polymorpha subsp. ruderalis]PTQ28842.1 hypothetical protein MARPO_0153s0012 [Marchantia polymorpha]PTQ28843.1 hypothetical protein MARPO_0153s0012 [Marchantia polymorpha]PTQ28844.1 hypothetical protein MARPO_0153s0012 [Marchantia polymorpha]|eukprot:PTQ28841.1 hypothetical protein MARPO_0153s0012 [Marchantia polymorpha]